MREMRRWAVSLSRSQQPRLLKKKNVAGKGARKIFRGLQKWDWETRETIRCPITFNVASGSVQAQIELAKRQDKTTTRKGIRQLSFFYDGTSRMTLAEHCERRGTCPLAQRGGKSRSNREDHDLLHELSRRVIILVGIESVGGEVRPNSHFLRRNSRRGGYFKIM